MQGPPRQEGRLLSSNRRQRPACSCQFFQSFVVLVRSQAARDVLFSGTFTFAIQLAFRGADMTVSGVLTPTQSPVAPVREHINQQVGALLASFPQIDALSADERRAMIARYT